ncbi:MULTISPECIES: PD-(D/E)XK nuclease family protein [unclassified Clostridium]|uniref:PD-(D/E)XK nuclease family protein n=1 Tax=unclassified Clostridium TaxID=2614128 RepID=UPI0020797CCD|nr:MULTISPECIES: PD-(D/E)XK nuclease family protein [unclassified Clostridium]
MSNRNYKFKNNTEGKEKFSFSKLSTFEHCQYGYYLTYIKHIRGKDSVYGILGTEAHECSQDLVKNKINNETAIDRFLTTLQDSQEVLGLKFPTPKSSITYEECISHFLENYHPKHKEFDIEKGFDTLVGKNKALIWGFIDLIIHNKDGSLDVVDYKTSSEFTKKDFIHKKMQLLIYAKALIEDGYKIHRLYFNMLKYCAISWSEINSKKQLVQKSTKAERNGIGLKLKSVAKRLLKRQGLDEIDIDMRIEKMIQTNEIDELIEDKFTISDYEVEVELSEESIEEMEDWVDNITNKIKENGLEEKNYKCVELNKGSEFFCNMLCGKECKFFNEYKENDNSSWKNRKKKEKEEKDEFEDLL